MSFRRPLFVKVAIASALAILTLAASTPWSTQSRASTAPLKVTLTNLDGQYPIGTPDALEPSGDAPPAADALDGYTMSYENDFTGTTIPTGWFIFTGIPGGDPGGHFGSSHVVVSDGLLDLNAYRDPNWHNRWVTGGLCQCSVAHTYGAFFERSRVTAAGANEVVLLWPVSNKWPPEIDFNETDGSDSYTSSSVHFGKTNHFVRLQLNIDVTQWHTYGVIWTPQSILYTVDGRIWGKFTDAADIPKVPMDLNIEQRQECEEHRQCPTEPESLEVDWVAEYLPASQS